PWVEMFLTWLSIEQGRSPRTVEAYRRDLDGLTAFLGKSEKSVEDCEASDLESFVASLKKAQLAAKTVARQLAACRTFFKFAVQENLRKDDPTGVIDGVSVPSGIPKALAEDEVAALLAACTGDDSYSRRDRALLEFLYATGARISEACGLSLSDLDMDQQVVRLFGKGSKERIVPFGAPAKRALEDWLSLGGRDVLSPKQWRTRADADAVFLGRGGRRISRQAAWNIAFESSSGSQSDSATRRGPSAQLCCCTTWGSPSHVSERSPESQRLSVSLGECGLEAIENMKHLGLNSQGRLRLTQVCFP
ncbi:MAG: hypothetical protein EBZ00_00750, partial [Actinobacteria bacterium]|nr:hypothetical protein [Actinomycetota bacterium]